MKQTIIILTLAVVTAMSATMGARAQENLLKYPQVRKYITTRFSFRDVNPFHQPEADSIAVLFRDILAEWESDLRERDDRLRARALELFYDNSSSVYEDSPDERRMTIRRYHCLIALALLPGNEYYGLYTTFIDDAREWVGRKLHPDFGLARELVTIDLVYALLEVHYGYAPGENGIKKLRENIAMLSERKQELYVTDAFIEEYTAITNLIVDALNNPRP